MARGGYQAPKKPASISGPGRFAKRTDGQPTVVPNVGDSPDLQYGDRSRLEAAQRIAAAAQAPKPNTKSQGVTGMPRGEQEALPAWLIDRDSQRPGEPVTAGLDMGPGPGSEVLQFSGPSADIRQLTYSYLYRLFGNPDALDALSSSQQETTMPAPEVAPTPPPPRLGA